MKTRVRVRVRAKLQPLRCRRPPASFELLGWRENNGSCRVCMQEEASGFGTEEKD